MRRHLAYLKYVVRHKWFVFFEGLRLGVPFWMLLLHDWDKFLPDEWFPYASFFYELDGTKVERRDKTGYYNPVATINNSFQKAWFLHAKRNKHHWQWWILPTEGEDLILLMPEVYVREMVADWRGAGRALGSAMDAKDWYIANKDKMKLHPRTRAFVEVLLSAPPTDILEIASIAKHGY
jgi:Family of unknown function (DUF5662)